MKNLHSSVYYLQLYIHTSCRCQNVCVGWLKFKIVERIEDVLLLLMWSQNPVYHWQLDIFSQVTPKRLSCTRQTTGGYSQKSWVGWVVSFPKSLPYWSLQSVKVTVHLQGCLKSKWCSTLVLNCRYLNPYIKLKLIRQLTTSTILWYYESSNFPRRLRSKSAQKPCLRFVKFDCIKKLQSIFKTGTKIIIVIVQKQLSTKKFWEIQKS